MTYSFKKYAAAMAVALMPFAPAAAQDFLPEALPAKPKVESPVRKVAPVSLVTEAEAAPSAARATGNSEFGESVVKTALQYLGARYRSGMSGPYAFDCSGFTSYIYGQENVPILRSSRSQYTQGTPIASISDLRKGDLVFFGGSRGSRTVGHVGIVTDVDPDGTNFSFVHASSSGGVKVSNLEEAYYSRRYIGARRIVEN